MSKSAFIAVGFAAFIAVAAPAQCNSLPDLRLPADLSSASQMPSARVSLNSEPIVAAAGQTVHLAVSVTVQGEAWLYSPTPRGQQVKPQPLVVKAAAGDWKVSEALFPEPKWHSIAFGAESEHNLVYEKQVTAWVPITVPQDAGGKTQTVAVVVTGQLCNDNGCYPVNQRASTRIIVGLPAGMRTARQWDRELPKLPPAPAVPTEKIENPPPSNDAPTLVATNAMPDEPVAGTESTVSTGGAGVGLSVWAAFGLALGAGILLNVMPCVLPVVPIKIMSLLQQARESRRRSVTLGLAYAGGILLFFVAIGAAGVALRLATGEVLNLNEPFQHPAGIIALTLLLVVVALGLFNVYTLVVSGGGGGSGKGHLGSLSMGLFTAILATPCSGPVLAAVFGWTQYQPAWIGGVVFLLLGAGMALPHVVLTSFPGLLARLPKPGKWMEYLKQSMGIVLLAVAAWLLSTLGEARWIRWVAIYAAVLAFCVWMAGTWVTFATPAKKRWAVRIAAVLIAVVAGGWMLPRPAPSAIDWQDFSPGALDAARERNQVAVVEFTAEWCLACKQLEMKVFNKQATADALRDRGVLAIRADVTQRATAGGDFLYDVLRESGPPVTAVYGPAIDKPLRLHGVFSVEDLLAAVDQAEGK